MTDKLRRWAEDHDTSFHPSLGNSASPGKSTLTSRHVMRKERDDNGVAANADVAIDRAAGSSGAPLPSDLRGRFESSLGADLSSVRVHTGEASAQANDAVGARAYATGQDIHFGAGQYNPASADGQFLIAHEVAHTVQQQGSAPTRQNKLEVSTPGDAHEVEADQAAHAMVSGRAASVSSASGVARQTIYRDAAPAPYKSEFGANDGSAGVMDQMAVKAGAKVTSGLPPIKVDTKYTLAQSAKMEAAAEDLANLYVPGAGKVGTEDATGVQTYQQQSAQYLTDVSRIATAQGAYDQAVGPSVLAAKSFASLKSVAHDSLGLVDEHALGDASAKANQINNDAYKDVSELGSDLTGPQKAALGEVLDKQDPTNHASVLGSLDGAVATAEGAVTRLRLDITQNAIAAQGVVLKKTEVEQKAKIKAKGDEKDIINKKIAALVDAASKVGTIAKVAATVATGGVDAVPGLATGGVASVETTGVSDATAFSDASLGGSKLSASSSGAMDAGGNLLTQAVGDIAKAYYAGELNKLNNAIDTASGAIAAAQAAGLELEDLVSKFELKKLAGDLVAKLQTLAQALQARKHHLAVEGAQADKKVSKGTKNKDGISQLLLLLSNAKDAGGLMNDAETQVEAAHGVVNAEWPKISGHRDELLPTYQQVEGFVVAGKQIHAGSSNDPDSAAVLQMDITIGNWKKTESEQRKYVTTVENAVTGLAKK